METLSAEYSHHDVMVDGWKELGNVEGQNRSIEAPKSSLTDAVHKRHAGIDCGVLFGAAELRRMKQAVLLAVEVEPDRKDLLEQFAHAR